MSAHATQATPHDHPGQHAAGTHAPNTHTADAPYYRQALHDLINMGTSLARLLHGQATQQAAAPAPQADAHPAPQAADAPPAPVPASPPDALIHLAIAFDRIARAVRRCIMLAQSLGKPAAPARDPARHRPARRLTVPGFPHLSGRSARDDADWDDARWDDRPAAEPRERPDAPDLDDSLTGRPVPEVIAGIRRDLNLADLPGGHILHSATTQDITHLCAQAAVLRRAREQGIRPQDAQPLYPGPGAVQPAPGLQPDGPAATPGAQPGPIHPGSHLPDPAEAAATVQRSAARDHARWRPPPIG